MSEKRQDPYHAKAAHENGLREEAMLQPLPSREEIKSNTVPLGAAGFNAAELLGRTAQQKVVKQRLQTTYSRFQEDDSWNTWNAGVANSETCLRRDLVRLSDRNEDIEATWNEAVRKPQAVTWSDDQRDLVHHETCHMKHGFCSKSCNLKDAQQLVVSVHRLVANGALPQPIQHDNLMVMYLLASELRVTEFCTDM